jgi:hypothetical protein
MECVLSIQENDAKMFDSLVNLDFLAATNEQTLLEADAAEANKAADEKKKQNIVQKAIALIESAIHAISEAFSNAIKKVKEFFDRDAKFYKKYADVIKKANFSNFPGIKNFAMPKELISKSDILEKIQEKYNQCVAGVETSPSKEEMDQWVEKYKGSEVEIKKEDYFDDKVDNFKPESGQISKILEVMENSSKTISDLKTSANKIVKDLNTVKSNLKKNKKYKDDNLEIYSKKCKYELASKRAKDASKETNAIINIGVDQIKTYRQALIALGNYALKENKGAKTEEPKTEEEKQQATEEAAFMEYALGLYSDEYVNSVFAV